MAENSKIKIESTLLIGKDYQQKLVQQLTEQHTAIIEAAITASVEQMLADTSMFDQVVKQQIDQFIREEVINRLKMSTGINRLINDYVKKTVKEVEKIITEKGKLNEK